MNQKNEGAAIEQPLFDVVDQECLETIGRNVLIDTGSDLYILIDLDRYRRLIHHDLDSVHGLSLRNRERFVIKALRQKNLSETQLTNDIMITFAFILL